METDTLAFVRGVYASAPPLIQDVLAEAASLVSEEGDNTEYDHALVELSSSALGLTYYDYRNEVDALLRSLR